MEHKRVNHLEQIPPEDWGQTHIQSANIWRRTSFGSQTEAGRVLVTRMLTVVTTLKCQKPHVLEFII
ncbi:hypothetical protein ACSQ6I_20305 [Anabaena sp. WFMT]|uniref:hypothetical protein n=1 Tax=Anabaena sp. WFMT TaxID=3449730 RepID=UPI003F24B828